MLIDGAETKDFALKDGGAYLSIPSLQAKAAAAKIEVHYKAK